MVVWFGMVGMFPLSHNNLRETGRLADLNEDLKLLQLSRGTRTTF